MRKLILNLAVSLDGFIEGPNGEYDWCIMDPALNFDAFLNSVDAIFYGRKSYALFGASNPDSFSSEAERDLFLQTSSKKKYVFSQTLKELEGDAVLVNGDITTRVQQIKQEPGKDIWLFGGADLAGALTALGLVDEFQLAIHPVLLGSGKPLFTDLRHRVGLQLKECRHFDSGLIYAIYNRA